MTHTMIVTKLPDENDDDIIYSIEGPHDAACRVWYPCADDKPCVSEPSPFVRSVEDPICDVEDWTFHGVEHRWIEESWMVLSVECASFSDGAQDDLNFIALKRGIGSHPVDIDYWGDGIWQALDLTPEPTRELRDPADVIQSHLEESA